MLFEATVCAGARRRGVPGTGSIALVGAFSGFSGVAVSAQLAGRAFDLLGIPYRRIEVGDFAEPPEPGSTSASAWLFYLNPPELMHLLRRWDLKRLAGLRFAYWAWELPRAPNAWRRAAASMDGVMTPSRFTAGAFAEVTPPVSVTPHPVVAAELTGLPSRAERTPGRPFRVVSLFDVKSSVARKNPFGALEAFQRAFQDSDDARLLFKIQNEDAAPVFVREIRSRAGPNVEFVQGEWPRERVLGLIASADALISLHRSEGFGLTMAEAMLVGVPVVATAWSGNLDFMDESCACLTPARLIGVSDDQTIYRGQQWADPDLGIAADHLRRLFADEAFARGLAERGRRRVLAQLDPVAWMESFPPSLQAAIGGAKAAGSPRSAG